MIPASERIGSLHHLQTALQSMEQRLTQEIEQINELWRGLGRAGGQREDHAAEILKRLRPHFAELARFAQNCAAQLEQTIADPFGDG